MCVVVVVGLWPTTIVEIYSINIHFLFMSFLAFTFDQFPSFSPVTFSVDVVTFCLGLKAVDEDVYIHQLYQETFSVRPLIP